MEAKTDPKNTELKYLDKHFYPKKIGKDFEKVKSFNTE